MLALHYYCIAFVSSSTNEEFQNYLQTHYYNYHHSYYRHVYHHCCHIIVIIIVIIIIANHIAITTDIFSNHTFFFFFAWLSALYFFENLIDGDDFWCFNANPFCAAKIGKKVNLRREKGKSESRFCRALNKHANGEGSLIRERWRETTVQTEIGFYKINDNLILFCKKRTIPCAGRIARTQKDRDIGVRGGGRKEPKSADRRTDVY